MSVITCDFTQLLFLVRFGVDKNHVIYDYSDTLHGCLENQVRLPYMKMGTRQRCPEAKLKMSTNTCLTSWAWMQAGGELGFHTQVRKLIALNWVGLVGYHTSLQEILLGTEEASFSQTRGFTLEACRLEITASRCSPIYTCVWVRRASLVAQWLKKKKKKKKPACQGRRHRFNPWIGKIPWRRRWQPTPVFMPGDPQTEEPGGLQSMRSQSWAQFCD